MAARWGTGEEMIKACKMEYFLPATLEETEILQDSICGLKHNRLDTGDAFEVMQGCLDSSILSIFEGVPTGEVKSGIDEESEATLLTALTEILDNVDDETLSPFDMLPDLEPLQVQKGDEHSPLKFLSLSCSSSEKGFYNSTQLLRKGGNDDTSFSELMQDLGVSTELDLCLPISLEHDGERGCLTLSDLAKHMHPYAMTLCVDGEEQLLPEGGIILEVMDKGEHGEPILAIQDLSCPLSLANTEEEQCVPESSLKNAKSEGSSPEVDSKISTVSDNKMEIVVIEKPQTKLPKKCPKNRKRKQGTEVTLVKKRVLNNTPKTTVEESNKEPDKQKKKKKVTFASDLSVKEHDLCRIECLPTTVHASMDCKFNPPSTTNALSSQAAFKLAELEPLDVLEDKPTGMLLENCRETGVSSIQELAVSQPSEPKPKSLSLQQYRLLRQQKKPAPKEEAENNSTKWPTLLEAPKDLPAIPCLPEPQPIEPLHSRPSTLKNPVTEIMPAWQPRGPGVPPTPEALLVPPASMLASSRKPVFPQTFSAKPVENLAASMSISTVPSSQTLSPSYSVVQNSIPKVNRTADWIPVKSPPVATKNGDLQNLHVDERAKCFYETSSASDHVIAASAKGQETSKSQDVPDIATTNEVTSNKSNAAIPPKTVNRQVVEPKTTKPIQAISAPQPTVGSQHHVAPIAAQPFSSAPIQARIMKLAKQMMGASAKVAKAKSPSEELIETFTNEIGIEAADLASLLEQFEETQSKEKVPEVCGGAAAVGNSSLAQSTQTRALKKAGSHNLASTADLTPPATPPHQMWKLLTPVTLLEHQKSEIPKSLPTKAVQIEPLPLPASKMQRKTQAYFPVGQAQPFSLDHDYCHPQREPTQNEVGHSCKGKQQIRIIIKSAELFNTAPRQNLSDHLSNPASENIQKNGESCSSVHVTQTEQESLTSIDLVTPEASPDRLLDSEIFQGSSERSPSPYLQKRSRSKRKCRARLPSRSGSTSSSSRSPSPLRKRCRSRSTSRSSSSRSCSRSRSRSRSRSLSPCQRRNLYSSSGFSFQNSRSRFRSPSPAYKPRRWSSRHSPDRISNYCYDSRVNEETQSCKTKAIEERRVVYIGRVHGGMTRKELRERFSYFGEIEDCTVYFREHGDNYGFVTYYNTKDAFNAIENGSKLRLPNELPFDLCFGGRRQFCRATYADLDSRRDFQPASTKGRFDALDFDTLLKQAQRNLKR